MKRNLFPLLGIAFVVAIISTGIFYGLFVGRLRSGASSPGKSIVVAARNLDRGTVLQEADVKLAAWGGADTPQGAFTAVGPVSGLTVISPVQENEPVVQSRVASRESGAGLGIASGMRAISIHATDSSGVVSILRPGYKVDVQLVSNQAELRTILQNIEVFAVNPAGDGHGSSPVVTLLVDPEGADMAGLGDSTAHLRLALRNPLDDGKTDLRRVTVPAMLQAPAAATRRPAPSLTLGASPSAGGGGGAKKP
jgi:pilus assembly protein CpaB